MPVIKIPLITADKVFSSQEITLVIPDDTDGEPAEGIDEEGDSDTEGGAPVESEETSESAEAPAED